MICFTSNHWDVEELDALGYEDDLIDTTQPIDVNDDGDFQAIKIFEKDRVAVTIWKVRYGYQHIEQGYIVYSYSGAPHHHTLIRNLTEEESMPYIQELIDAEILEVTSNGTV